MMQVWTATGMVGTVNIDPRSVRGKTYSIPMLAESALTWDPDEEILATETKIDNLNLTVGKRSHRIDDFEMHVIRGGIEEMLKAHRIPEDADKMVDMNRMATIFSWPVFMLEPDQYERLFDLDIFEPV